MWEQLPRKAAGLSLILAPLLGLAAVCAWPPLRTSDRAQIAAIAANPGRWYVFALFILLSSYLLVPAVLALMRVLRPSLAGLVGPGREPGAVWGPRLDRRFGNRADVLANGRTRGQPQPDGCTRYPL